jgi:hypothetical protein
VQHERGEDGIGTIFDEEGDFGRVIGRDALLFLELDGDVRDVEGDVEVGR